MIVPLTYDRKGRARHTIARNSTRTLTFGAGGCIRVVFLPVNQAWSVLWHDHYLRGPIPKAEAVAYAEEIARGT